MMNPLRLLHDSATVPRLIAAAIVCGLIRYGLMPGMGKAILETPGAGPLDLMFAYTPDEAFASIAAMGEAGRGAYRLFLMTADVIYPVSYVLLLGWAIALAARATRFAGALWLLAPVAGLFLFDMCENTAVIALLVQYPARPEALAWMASAFTTLKWLCAGAAALVLLGLAALRLGSFAIRRPE